MERLVFNAFAPYAYFPFLQGAKFPGLIGLVEAYLDTLDISPPERQQIGKYVDLIRRRADGTCLYFALVSTILKCHRFVAYHRRMDARVRSITPGVQIRLGG